MLVKNKYLFLKTLDAVNELLEGFARHLDTSFLLDLFYSPGVARYSDLRHCVGCRDQRT